MSTTIEIDWVRDEPYAPNVTVTEDGQVLITWVIKPGSGITAFEISGLNTTVFTNQQSLNGHTEYQATDNNVADNAGDYNYTITASHTSEGRKSHDPKIKNDPT